MRTEKLKTIIAITEIKELRKHKTRVNPTITTTEMQKPIYAHKTNI
jgi:hypothetical protein